ncbi:ligase-associated DNA damage response endonuclease PdeM [Oceanicola sp. D3]|uniref:ligase-associated DNA damage response endonuclease PdeM n=1 Tax=Oceanicola sp. D3 TaxID=2587163 RepID=UPI0011239AE6|nr:ligase-associated DNA damage response endonuclease PdeM [Oceanicola sp. D3]QDC08896.1 ligase-associated DNA damage response endonuclease PdeM [Oceanicola sp. D3]
MNAHSFTLAGCRLEARPSGALWLPDARLLCVSDLHLGKSERMARRGGALLPPYETEETLARLEAELAALMPRSVVCLGDSFDDLGAALALPEDMQLRLQAMQAGRRWIWIEGNHDPGPLELGGEHKAELAEEGLVFRHIASPRPEAGEVSGHYHPKHRLPRSGTSRPAFVYDQRRLILPAFGAYTGGLRCSTPVLRGLFSARAIAVLTGPRALAVPLE